jgi:hypothetical protein
MTTKGFEGHAFGSQSSRFNTLGVHPNLLATGRMPYESEFTTQTVYRRSSAAALLGFAIFLFFHINHLLKSKNIGPGTYDVLKYNEFSEDVLTRKTDGPNWERAFVTEKLAKMPHLLYQDAYKKKQEDVRQRNEH